MEDRNKRRVRALLAALIIIVALAAIFAVIRFFRIRAAYKKVQEELRIEEEQEKETDNFLDETGNEE